LATTRTPQILSLTAAAPTVITPDAAGEKFAIPTTGVYLRIINGSGSSITATLTDYASVTPEAASAFTPNVAITVGAGATRQVQITDARRFTNPADGLASLAWSAVTSVTFELAQ
jgi:hypothetical protein